MTLELRVVPGCPHAQQAQELFTSVAQAAGRTDLPVRQTVVTTEEQARTLGFRGSPSFVVDGRDLFPGSGQPGLSCRVYVAERGLAGVPQATHLQAALLRASADRASAAGAPGAGAHGAPCR